MLANRQPFAARRRPLGPDWTQPLDQFRLLLNSYSPFPPHRHLTLLLRFNTSCVSHPSAACSLDAYFRRWEGSKSRVLPADLAIAANAYDSYANDFCHDCSSTMDAPLYDHQCIFFACAHLNTHLSSVESANARVQNTQLSPCRASATTHGDPPASVASTLRPPAFTYIFPLSSPLNAPIVSVIPSRRAHHTLEVSKFTQALRCTALHPPVAILLSAIVLSHWTLSHPPPTIHHMDLKKIAVTILTFSLTAQATSDG